MKIAHRNPAANWFAIPESDPVDLDYDAEVQQSTQRAEREYERAQERLARAERRLAKAVAARQARKRITQLQELVSLRRAELAGLQRLMMTAPVVHGDKQIRHRTGRDDHLELGIRKQPSRRRKAS